jgi:hypothetical protein
VSNYQFSYWKIEKIVNFTIWEALVYAVVHSHLSIQSDSRIASDLTPLFLQEKLLSHRILRCFSI